MSMITVEEYEKEMDRKLKSKNNKSLVIRKRKVKGTDFDRFIQGLGAMAGITLIRILVSELDGEGFE